MRAEVIAEARTWLGTPFIHAQAVKGAGVDCAMLLVKCYQTVGVVPPDYDPRPYPRTWYLHRSDERFMQVLLKFAHRIDVPQPGDVALYRMGRSASHGAILINREEMIHAYQPSGIVEQAELAGLAHCLDSYWAVL